MSIIELSIKDIKPNPFKKFINEGKLDEERIEKLKESIEHGTLPEGFTCRKVDGEFQQAFGHHRLEALKQVKGKDYKVQCGIVEYSDEQMLVDLVRENITQRDSDFQDTEGSIVLARNWLQSGVTGVKQFYSHLKDGRKAPNQNQPEADSFRSIAKFLSKQGKAISHETVKNYLDIYDKLSPKLHKKIKKLESATKEDREESLGVRTAKNLAQQIFNKKDQEMLFDKIKVEKLNRDDSERAILTFKNVDEKVKQKVREGKLDLVDLDRWDVQQAEFLEEDEEIPETWEKAEGLKKAFNQAQSSWQKVLILLADIKIMKDYNYSVAEIDSFIKDIKDVEPFANDAVKKLGLVKSK